MLAFEIYYLSGRSYSKDFLRGKDSAFSEWPPHPGRFFSALVAAFKECELGAAEREALEWLEQQGAPQISADGKWERPGVISFVPPNDCDWTYDKKLKMYVPTSSFIPVTRTRKARRFPSATLENPFVYFAWPHAESANHTSALIAIAERVTYLGSSASLVQVRLCESAPPPTLMPDHNGEVSLRIFRPGRLKYLEETWESGNRPDQYSWGRYRQVQEVLDNTPAETVFGDLFVFHLKSPRGQSLAIQRSLAVTDAVQRRLLELAEDSPPDLLAEAGQQARCTITALPHVGSKHADGRIIGFAVILPKEVNSDERRAMLRLLGKFKETPQLVIPGRGTWEAEHITGIAPREALKTWTWTKPAGEWRSVTPMLFDEFPDDRRAGRTFGELVRRYCDQVGLPSPREVSISPYPSVTGAAPVFEYTKQRQKQDRWRYAAHVTLFFDRAVRGPVLLGAGRYFGMGLLRPMHDRQEEQDEL